MKDGLIRALRAALDFNRQAYLPMTLGGHPMGWVRCDRVARLHAWPEVFRLSEDGIQLRPVESRLERGIRAGVAGLGWRRRDSRLARRTRMPYALKRAATRCST